jgi:hypothetical protein
MFSQPGHSCLWKIAILPLDFFFFTSRWCFPAPSSGFNRMFGRRGSKKNFNGLPVPMDGVEQQLEHLDRRQLLPIQQVQSLGTSCLQLQASAQGLIVDAGSSNSSDHIKVGRSLDAMRQQAAAILTSIDSLRHKVGQRPSIADSNPKAATHKRHPTLQKFTQDHRHSSLQNVLAYLPGEFVLLYFDLLLPLCPLTSYLSEETPRNSGLGNGRRSSFAGIVNRVIRRRDSEMQFEDKRASAPRSPDHQMYPLASTRWLVVDPNGLFRRYWDLLTLVLLAYITIFAPYQIAFLDQYNFSNIKDWVSIFLIDRTIDVFFFCDLLLNFRSGWVSKSDSSRIEFESAEAARRYFKSWFVVDFVSTLPFDACQTFVNNPASLRLPKLLRLLRLFKLLKMLRMNRIFKRWQASITIKHGIIRLCTFAVLVSIVSHWYACFFYLAATLSDPTETTWVKEAGLENAAKSEVYLAGLYWAVMTL